MPMPNKETLNSEDLSILGDTKMQSEVTLQNLREIISMQLKENNQCIISQLQTTIKTQINQAIAKLKEDVTK